MDFDAHAWIAEGLQGITGQRAMRGGLPFQRIFPFAKLDFSPESIDLLDGFLTANAEAIKALPIGDGQRINLLQGLGAYLGEVYRRLAPVPQRWMSQEELLRICPWWEGRMEETVNWVAALVMRSGRVSWPFSLVKLTVDNLPSMTLGEALIQLTRGAMGRQMKGHPRWETATSAGTRLAGEIKSLYGTLPALLSGYKLPTVELRLDFSFDSVVSLDRLLDELISSNQIAWAVLERERNLLPFMAYVGEVIRRRSAIPYRWVDHQDAFPDGDGPAFDIATAVLLQAEDGSYIQPGVRVYDRLYADAPSTLTHFVRWECRQKPGVKLMGSSEVGANPLDAGEDRALAAQMMLSSAMTIDEAVWKHFGIMLDGSTDDIAAIEAMLGELHQEWTRRKDHGVAEHWALLLGFRLGLVVAGAHGGGTWGCNHQAAGAKSFPLALKALSGEIFPVGWCWKRIVNGHEDNVLHKYQGVLSSREA